MVSAAEADRLKALDSSEASTWPDPGTWWTRPQQLDLTSAYWRDPEPTFQGMLSSDRILAYHYAVGRFIRPLQAKHLKPASYELTLGPTYLLNGKPGVLDAGQNKQLTIPPNSIVYVSMREQLLMPHWLVGRFDLAIAYIYQGLLLGTGPQVDPGFQGVLSCPLHNISSQPITMNFCEPFAKIDFVKTSFGRGTKAGTFDHVETDKELRELDIAGYHGHLLKTMSDTHNWRQPIFFPVTDVKQVASSVYRIEREVEQNTSVVRRTRNFSLAGAVGIVALIATLFAAMIGAFVYTLTYTDGKVQDRAHLAQSVQQLNSEVAHLCKLARLKPASCRR